MFLSVDLGFRTVVLLLLKKNKAFNLTEGEIKIISNYLKTLSKKDFTEDNNYKSLLPYILHMFKYEHIVPKYQTVYDATKKIRIRV